MLPKFVKLLWGPFSIVIYSSQVVQEISQNSDGCGQPVTVASKQNVIKVKCVIKEDPKMTKNEIKGSLNLSSGTLDPTFRHHLGV